MKKILAIDDQIDNLITLKAVIKTQLKDYEVITSTSGKEGIELAIEEQPDTILLDIIMPEMDGFETCKNLKSNDLTKHIPIILLTAIKTDPKSRVKGLEIGADAFLSKPIDPYELMAQVGVTLRIKKAEDELREDRKLLAQKVSEKTSELQESEERFKKAILLSPNPIMIHNEDGELLQSSKGFSLNSGYTKDDVPTYKDFLNKAITNKNLSNYNFNNFIELNDSQDLGNWEINTKTGDTRFWQTFVTPLGKFKDGKKSLLTAAFDITPRIKAQEELLKLNIAIEQSANTVVITNTEGNIEYTNPTIEKVSGYSSEEAMGQNPRFLNAGTLPKEYYTEMWKTISAGKIWEGEFHNKKKSGELYWEHAIITPIKNQEGIIKNYLAVKENITEKKLAAESLKKSEHQYKTLFENAGDGICIIDLGGNIIEANQSFADMHGYSISEARSLNVTNIDTPETANKFKSRIKKIIDGQTIRINVDHRHKNGNIIHLDVIACPIELENQNRIVAFHRDITKQIETKKNLEKALEKATEADRLKTAFLHNVSHEIRTPMNGIMGFADLLKTPDLSYQDMMNYVDVISISGRRMLNTLNQLMDISMLETGQSKMHLSIFNINEELERNLSFFKPEVDNKGMTISFNKNLDDNDALVKTDKEKFNAVIANLIKNSIKYSNKGNIEFGYKLNGKQLIFYVKDEGIGIPPNRQEAIFERFVQADIEDKKAYEGSGLGLSISKSYVEMMEGKIWVESEPGKGSTFYFTLPYSKIQSEPAANKITSDKAHIIKPTKKVKLLIVEDEEFADAYLTEILNEDYFELLHAYDGVDAVNTSRDNPDLDIILMDIKLPLKDGYTATKEIRKFNTKVKIIAQTAYALSGDKEKTIKAGCDDYISKPIDKTLLLQKINKLV